VKRTEPTPTLWRYGSFEETRVYVLAPFAGGSAYAMGNWPRLLLREDEAALVLQYPGRGPRAAEPQATSITALADEAADAVLEHSTGPVVLVGHSLGGVLGHTLALRLADAGRPVELLVASAARPPSAARLDADQVLAMTDEEWIREITRYGDYDPQLIEDPDLLDLIVPVLRADYLMLARHVPENRPVRCPVLAVGGVDDIWVTGDHLDAWGEWTTAALTTRTLPGGHFYYRDDLPTLTGLIHGALDGNHAREVSR
jgi:surfactin synthase thioesterase subunit